MAELVDALDSKSSSARSVGSSPTRATRNKIPRVCGVFYLAMGGRERVRPASGPAKLQNFVGDLSGPAKLYNFVGDLSGPAKLQNFVGDLSGPAKLQNFVGDLSGPAKLQNFVGNLSGPAKLYNFVGDFKLKIPIIWGFLYHISYYDS